MIRFDRFWEGKKHMVTMSYDDGKESDRRLIELFNRYGIRGTFHLNSGCFGNPGYVREEEVKDLYRGHEVSVHTKTHPHLEQLAPQEAVHEVMDDRAKLEELCGYPVRGMSYPFGTYTPGVIETLRQCGIVYSRTVAETQDFGLPMDFLAWHPTTHHDRALNLVDTFLEDIAKYPWRAPLFYIWGHSYEMDQKNTWDQIEELVKRLSGHDEVWYATNIEIYDYIAAQRALHISVDGKILENPTAVPVWVSADGETVKIEAGGTVCL